MTKKGTDTVVHSTNFKRRSRGSCIQEDSEEEGEFDDEDDEEENTEQDIQVS